MSENYDDLINEAFGDFAFAAAPSVQAAGSAEVRATIKRRRKVRLSTFSVLAVLCVAIPVAAFAANPRGNSSPPVLAGTPEMTQSAPTSPTPSASAPDGQLTAEQLIAAGSKVGSWAWNDTGCSNQIHAKSAAYSGPRDPYPAKVINTNLDADAAMETAVLVRCTHIEGYYWQVVGYDRSAAGEIVSLGTIIPALPNHNDVSDIAIRPQGGVIATVKLDSYTATPPDQKREYAWVGDAFKQVAGPTSFPPTPNSPTPGSPQVFADLALTVTPIVLSQMQDGLRSATVTVTVTNNGPNASGTFWVAIGGALHMAVSPQTWVVTTVDTAGYATPQPHAPLAAGESVSLTVTLTVMPAWWDGQVLPATCFSTTTTDPNAANSHEIQIPVT